MAELLVTVLSYAALPVAAALAGAIVASFKPPDGKLRSMIQHFAAGVVFSVVAVELLPDVVKEHRPLPVVIGFALGVATMLGLKLLTGHDAEKSPAESGAAATPGQPALPWAMLFGVGVDVLVDGFLIGLGFAAGAQEGKLLTLALTVELLSLGLASAAELGQRGFSRGRAIRATVALSLLILPGAGLGATLLHGLSEALLEVVLSFGLAALLYLVTEELLVEAHEEPETPLITATFFAGFLLFLIIGMVS